MNQLRVSNYQSLFFVLAVVSFSMVLAFFPGKTSALEASAQTMQVLPPGGTSCAPVSATNFTPYIYNGALHSFEFTLPDASYVALLGSVGNTPLSFQLMSRQVDAAGMLRIHVDVETTALSGTLPLTVTLLSARSGMPVCFTVVSMSLGSGPIATTNNPAVSTVPTTPTTVSETPTTPNVSPAASVSTPTATNPASTTAQGSVVNTIQNPLRNVCASDTSAYRLWLILLVLYVLIVGTALWAEFPASLSWARTPERIASIILVFLLLLLAFWYFSISCRAALWMPLVAFLVAVLGLLAAFWNHPRVTQLLLIQEPPKEKI